MVWGMKGVLFGAQWAEWFQPDGALAHLFMQIVVLPLSAVPKDDIPFIYVASEFVAHWFCVGLPIALSVGHYSR
jgi:hypothetical protein